MKRITFLAFALAALTASALPTLTLSGDYFQINVGGQGILLGDGAVGAGAVGFRFDRTGTGTFGGFEDVNDWGYPSYARTIASGPANYIVHYGGGSFGPLGLLMGPTVTDTSFGTVRQATVTTVYAGLVHVRTYTFDKPDKEVQIHDAYTNISNAPMLLAAVDSFDPDQGIPRGLGFGTYNDVVTPSRVEATDGWTKIYYEARDGMGMANVAYGLESFDPYQPLNDPNGAFADVGISMQYDFGMVDPYHCTRTSFVLGGEPVPDPATLATLGVGLVALIVRRRR